VPLDHVSPEERAEYERRQAERKEARRALAVAWVLAGLVFALLVLIEMG